MDCIFSIKDVLGQTQAVVRADSYHFEKTLNAILKSITADDPKKITIEWVSKE